jgi:membrane associated rhomboid family serine protease
MSGPMKSAPAINLPPVVLWLGLALAAVHFGRHLLGETAQTWVLLSLAFVPLRYGEFGDLLPGGAAAQLWSPATYALLHADAVHLLVNLVWMASFGGALARRFGAIRFLLLSLAAAVGGAGLHYVFHAGEEGLMIGASGAVSGMMAATARFAFAPGGPLAGGRAADSYQVPAEPLFAVFTRSRALGFIVVWFAANLIFGLGGGMVAGVSGPIAWEAHIGGFLAGLLLFTVLDPVRPASLPPEPAEAEVESPDPLA